MKKSELKRLVEQKVDEAWHNNGKDFARAAAKGAFYTGLGLATLYGCDKGMDNQEAYQNRVNKEAAVNSRYNNDEFNDFCEKNHLNPNDGNSTAQFNDYLEAQRDSLRESIERRVMRRVKMMLANNR